MNNMTKVLFIVLGVFLTAVLFGAGYYISKKNTLVTLSEDIKGQWAQVENQLKRRNDLIPNFVNTVKGYAKHEKEILENIAASRAKLAGSQNVDDKMKHSNELSSALSRLLVVVERYPELKADANFRALQDELAGTENRLAFERKSYNDKIRFYNTEIKKFPGSLIAGMAGFAPEKYFDVPDSETAVPQVNFDTK